MNALPFLTAALMVFLPYALTTEPNGSLRVAVARFAENKGKDVQRIVRKLDNSKIKLEPNEPFVILKTNNPLSRHETSVDIWREKFPEPGTYTLGHMVTKKLSTTWSWSSHYNMDYVLNVTQPVSIKVPDNYLVHVNSVGVNSLGKDFWEFNTPLPWDEAKATCRAAGLKLAQPKTQKEVEELQKTLHKRIHNRESGCQSEAWNKKNGYCLLFVNSFVTREEATTYCESMNSTLPFPALGNVTAWQEAVKDSLNIRGRSNTHAGALKAPDGQWLWEDDSAVQEAAWTPGHSDGTDNCAVLYPNTGSLADKDCSFTWQTLCQGHSSSHWLGANGSDDSKCIEWIEGGKCIEKEDIDPDSNMDDLWQTGPHDDLISSNFALQLQIENAKPFTLREIRERRPFLCESECPLGFINLGSQCLLVQRVWLTWPEAHAACVKMGLQLYETEQESKFNKFLHQRRIIGSYWIGGKEKAVAGKEVDFSIIKKLPFICELAQGTRKMNVTNQLSYSDQEKVRLPKVVTPSSNCTVTVSERTITETYPFSVQMDITGWIWVEYNNITDEHGSNHCDNNNDWVSGEWCYAHSKWGYSTSYLHDGDQIMAQGDNARLMLNGTVTYNYNEHEVSLTQCGSESASNSAGGKRRSRRTIPSSDKGFKNSKSKAMDTDDNNHINKPLMSQLGRRVGEWVRALAQEKNRHLVAYTIEQLSASVTDMKLENGASDLLTPGSIFEEIFENGGSEHVIASFSKTKNVANSYKWSVSKGISIEDSHISSYSKTNSQSASNTFKLSNNIAQTDGRTDSTSEGKTEIQSNFQGTSNSKSSVSSNSNTNTDSEQFSNGGASSETTSQINSEGSSHGSSGTSSEEVTSGGTISSSNSETSSNTNTQEDVKSQGSSSSQQETQQSTITETDSDSSTKGSSSTSSNSKTESKSDTSSKSEDSSSSHGWEVSVSASAGFEAFGVSASVSASAGGHGEYSSSLTTENSATESTDETSTNDQSTSNENTNTHEQSHSTNTGKTDESSTTSDVTNSEVNTVGQDHKNTSEEIITHGTSQINDTTTTNEIMTNSEEAQISEMNQHFENIHAAESESSEEFSQSEESNTNIESSQEREDRYALEQSRNQERSNSYEKSHGVDVNRNSGISQDNQRTRTQHVNMDRTEDISSTEEETLTTQNEVTIPPNTKVKIEWRVEQGKTRLPWKATVHMTGWINVRFKNNDKVCDIHRHSGWTYNYTKPCKKDNRLYGYPLSALKDQNYIQQGDGLRFVASGVFEGIIVASHYIRVTETKLTKLETDDGVVDDINNHNNDQYMDNPKLYSRRKRSPISQPSKVTNYHLEFDEYGNGRSNIRNNKPKFLRQLQANKD